MESKIRSIILSMLLLLFFQCATEDSNSQYVPPSTTEITHANDQYLYDSNGVSLFERYGTATRWRWNDNFISPTQRATPIDADFVIPVAKLVDYLWVGPYASTGSNAVNFIKELFPAELVFIGSYIFNDDGTVVLGYAEGGARVTLLNLNSFDFQDRNWLANPGGGVLATVHHEFSHIVHQNYGIPAGFNTISDSYLGNNWSNGVSRDDAIKLGMVRNYGTLNEYEDFCEIISHFLVVDQATFEQDFINLQDCSTYADPDDIINCDELNKGRLLIKQKVDLVVEYFNNNFNIDLLEVRDVLQSRLNNLVDTGVIPE